MKITNKKSLFTIVALVTIFLFAPLVTKTQNIPVPFTTQAPYSNWNQPWQDFCEEAVILMIDSYYTGGKLDKPTASKELLQINKIKENLKSKNIKYLDQPYTRFEGKEEQQETFFIEDPHGNVLELKTLQNS